MKGLIIIIILISINLIGFSQTYSIIVSDSEIISFLSWEVTSTEGYSDKPFLSAKKKISRQISSWDSLNFIMPDSLSESDFSVRFHYLFHNENKLDTIFNEGDKEFLFLQFTGIKDSIWENKILKVKLTNKKIKKNPNRYYYSIPLFSKDKNCVIIYREYYCGGLCGYGGYYIYRRNDQKSWKLVRILNEWDS